MIFSSHPRMLPSGALRAPRKHLESNWHLIAVVLAFYVVTLFSTIGVAGAADAYVVATMPEPRSGSAVVWAGTKAFILGGNNSLTNFDSILEFDPTTGAVAYVPETLSIGVSQLSAIWDGNDTYTFAGKRFQVADCPGCQSITDIQRFSPNSPSTSSIVAQMPSLRHGTAAAWDGRFAYIFGGITGTSGGHLDEIVRFEPATLAVVTMPGRLSHPRNLAPAVWTPYGIYLFGGYRLCDNQQPCDDIERYDPTTDTVTLLTTRLPQPLQGASAVWSGRFIYIFGGEGSDQILQFDPTDESITILDDRLPAELYFSAAFWDGRSAYIVGGSTASAPSAQILRYDPPAVTVFCSDDIGTRDSQIFSFDLETGAASTIGPVQPLADLETLILEPTTGQLYGITAETGELWTVDKSTGDRTLVCTIPTVRKFREIAGSSLHPTTGELWAYQWNKGLVTIDLASCELTKRWHHAPAPGVARKWSGIAWKGDASALYGSRRSDLYLWDPETETVTLVCSNLPYKTDGLEYSPDGALLGSSNSKIYEIDPESCEVTEIFDFPDREDIEALAFEVPAGQ